MGYQLACAKRWLLYSHATNMLFLEFQVVGSSSFVSFLSCLEGFLQPKESCGFFFRGGSISTKLSPYQNKGPLLRRAPWSF